jgi:hypothetical protein
MEDDPILSGLGRLEGVWPQTRVEDGPAMRADLREMRREAAEMRREMSEAFARAERQRQRHFRLTLGAIIVTTIGLALVIARWSHWI